MGKHILLIQGHPDAGQRHLCHALEDAYARGASAAGHEIRRIDVATLDFPLLRSQHEWEQGELPPNLAPAQDAINWAEHLAVLSAVATRHACAAQGLSRTSGAPRVRILAGGQKSAGGKGP
ncbi:MAG: NAD(P)H-dependent oxidoreductase [Thiobacillus sp.]|nr:NAD(P)H-dependent oxidoreductase [Thiobacillus sp.]